MQGVIMETMNGRAVLLTKGGEFVNVKNKGYSVGDKVNITSNTSRLCAMAASLVIVCAGIGSYFVPAGYVSVDINPSLMMTLNMYNRVINVTSFNDDARILLNKTDIKGKSAEESVEMLIDSSEEIGYINDNNRDVILEVVPGIRKPNMEGIKHKNIDVTNEIADRETLRIAQNIGVSIAKVKAIEEYTEKNGGDMRSNAAKFNDKSVKEIRNIMLDNNYLSDKKPSDALKPQERSNKNISEPAKPLENYEPPYSINNNSFSAGEPKHKDNIPPPANQMPKNEYRPPENIPFHGENKQQEKTPVFSEQPHWDIKQLNPALPPIEPRPQENVPAQNNNILQNKSLQTSEPEKEKQPVDIKPIQIEPKPQDNVSNSGGSKPQHGTSKPSVPEWKDNKPSDNVQKMTEQKPQDSIPNHDRPTQTEGQNPDITAPSDSISPEKQKPDISEHDKPTAPDKSKPIAEPDNQQSKSDNNTYKPQPCESKQENNMPPQAEQQPSEPKQENNSPPQMNEPQLNEQKRENGFNSEPKPQNSGSDNMTNESMGGHNESREMS